MRRLITALAVLIVAQSLTTASVAQETAGAAIGPAGRTGPAHGQTGIVTYVDPTTMNFVCRVSGTSQRYWVTRGTRFRSGRPNATIFDLFLGQPVEVMSHDSGRLEIADVVQF